MDELRAIAGAGGCQIINAAGTYTAAGGTLINGVRALQVVTGTAAAITAMQLKPLNGTAANLPAVNNIVGVDLTSITELLTFTDPISSITVATGVVLVAYAG